MHPRQRLFAFLTPYVRLHPPTQAHSLSPRHLLPTHHPQPAPHRPLTHIQMSITREQALSTPFPETAQLSAEILTPSTPDIDLVSAIISTSAGARGLFIALLSEPRVTQIKSGISAPLLHALVTACRDEEKREDGGMSHFLYIRHLLVKNVVMPSAMVVKYRGMGSEGVQYVAGSELTRDRATVLLGEWVKLEEELGMRYALPVAREMKRGLEDDEGTFGAFANKWGYAAEERAAGVESLGRACGDVL